MKKHLLFALLFACTLFATTSKAQTLVHYWNFSNVSTAVYVPTTAVNATYSRIDTTMAKVWYTTLPGTSSTFSSYYDAYANTDSAMGVTPSWNARFGDPAGVSFRARNPSDSMQLLAYMPTTHYQNPVIKFATETSSTTSGMQVQNYSYSTDGGTTWSTSGLSLTITNPVDTHWMAVTINMNSTTDPAIKNNPSLIFRVLFATNTSGTSGNNRFDNLTMEADTFIAPTSVAAVAFTAPEYTLYPNPVVNSVEITADIDGTKSIMIHAADGKTVYAGLQSGKHISLDVANLAAGTYFVTIQEPTGTTSTIKFTKQ